MNKNVLYAVLVGSLLLSAGFARCEKSMDDGFTRVFVATTPSGGKELAFVETESNLSRAGADSEMDNYVVQVHPSSKADFVGLSFSPLKAQQETAEYRNARWISKSVDTAKKTPEHIANATVSGLKTGGRFVVDHKEEISSAALVAASWTLWGVKNILKATWWTAKQLVGVAHAALVDGSGSLC